MSLTSILMKERSNLKQRRRKAQIVRSSGAIDIGKGEGKKEKEAESSKKDPNAKKEEKIGRVEGFCFVWSEGVNGGGKGGQRAQTHKLKRI